MKQAIEELENTIAEAEAYSEQDTVYVEDLRSHIAALNEDIGILERRRTTDVVLEKASQDVAIKARRLKRTLERQVNAVLRDIMHNEEPETENEDKGNAEIKFSKLSMPTFDGNPASYQEFADIFDKIVQKEKGITELKKWLLLKQNVTGKAAEMIAYLPLAEESYATAMQIFKNTFAGKRRAITSLTHQLEAMPTATMDTWSLRLTHSRIEGILMTLEKRGEKAKDNPFLTSLVMGKYPEEVRLKVITDEDMSLDAFQKEVGRLIRIREGVLVKTVKASADVVVSKPEQTRFNFNAKRNNNGANVSKSEPAQKSAETSRPSKPPEQTVFSSKEAPSGENKEAKRGQKRSNSRTPYCFYCEKEHWSDECSEFATIASRKKKLVDHCTICLRKKHEGVACIRVRRCVHCNENSHHRSLCPKKFGTKGGANASSQRTEFVAFSTAEAGFFTLLLEVSGRGGKRKQVRAVIDTAGGRTLVTEELVNGLGVKREENEKLLLKGVGRKPTALECMGKAVITLHPQKEPPIEIEAQVVEYITDDLPAPDVDVFRKAHPECADLLMPETGRGKKIDLLLGRDSLFDVLTLEKSMRIGSNVQLMSTVFGWLILERDVINTPEKRKKMESVNLLLRTEDAVRRLWELDCVGLKDIEAAEVEMERKALEQFYATIQYKNGRYEVAWPYVDSEPDVQTSFGLALGRLRSLYKKLSNDRALLLEYDKLIRTQITEDIAEAVETSGAKKGKVIRYIPHQAVIRPGKSTPVRIVYDASAKCSKTDRSLNECMVKGLNWVPDLPSSLLRFRRNRVAITADIERAFHQISIREEDRDAVRYLWVRKLSEPPEKENLWVLRFKRMAFGIVASPFLLAATIKYHIRSKPYEFADMVEAEMYADNLVISLPEQVSPVEFYEKVKKLFADMSMNLTKWATNSVTLRKSLKKEDIELEPVQVVLGMRWLTNSDEISLKAPTQLREENNVTKRRALRELASIFDPMGWLAPTTLLAKQYIRELWEQKVKWDERLTEEMEQKWRTIADAMKNIETVKLKRKYFDKDLSQVENKILHLFVDASKLAYAAVIYISAKEQPLAFISAKNRLAPKKELTIPRLELLALYMGSKYVKFVKNALQLKEEIPIVMWTDSRCVLAWVQTKKILPSVIEKQVQEIRKVGATKVNYVPTTMNPADVVSRGASIHELNQQNWWRGPQWLNDEQNWPKQQLTKDDENAAAEEEKMVEQQHERALLLTGAKTNKEAVKSAEGAPFALDPKNFSTLHALLRRTAWCAFCLNKLLEIKTHKKLIKVDHLEKNYSYARQMWIRWDQTRTYPQAYNKNQKLTGELKNLRLFVDEDDILRCETRILNALLPEDTLRPILLVRGSPLTRLIIMNAHLKNFHAGTSQTLAEIRKLYWLPKGRQQVYHIIKTTCMTCKRYDARPYQVPETPPLPEFRVRRTNAVFECIGIDVFGPFVVKEDQQRKAKRKKVWVMIFTCLVVRAVHMETLHEMTSFEFLIAFKKFAARRGTPRLVISDNAPQFHVLDGKFQRLWQALEENTNVTEYFATNEIKWEFIPQSAPWMGGVYERLIRNAKNAFERTYGRVILWIKQFELAVIEIEAVLNTRPLTYIGKEKDAKIITPNSFLKVKHQAIPARITEQEAHDILGQLWKSSEEYLNIYWREWADYYIAMIKERDDKLRQEKGVDKKQPEKGDVVLLVESDKKRSSWMLATIEELIESSDGKARSALIKLPNGARTVRPLLKLAPIHQQKEIETGRTIQLNRQRTAVVQPEIEDHGDSSAEEIILGPGDL